MKKKVITFSFVLSVFFASAQGVKFEQKLSFKQALQKAKIENKYVMVDAYATWCGPCKQMNISTFPKKKVGDFINSNFISLQIQMDRTENDSELVKSHYSDAEAINRFYAIKSYPSILFFSPGGEIVHRTVGFVLEDGLISAAKSALTPDNQFYTQYNLFKAGKIDTAFLKKFALQAEQIREKQIAKRVSEKFIEGLNTAELKKPHNLNFVYKFTTSSQDKYFSMFQKKPEMMNALLKEGASENKVKDIIIAEEIEPFLKKNTTPDWISIEEKVRRKYGALGLEAFYGERLIYSYEHKQWEDYGKFYVLYFNSAVGRSKFSINALSWVLFENVTDTIALEAGIKAMEYNLEKFDTNDPMAFDTYANLLYKVGRKSDAIKWEEKAVNISSGNKSFVETLKKMTSGERTWPDK